MTTVAVVGGGAAGIGAARTLLQEGMDVLLLEAAPRLGGNCRADEVRAGDGRTYRVDIGVSDFNRTTFRQFSGLVDELGLETRPIGTDTSFASADGHSLCSFRGGRWSFGAELADPEVFLRDLGRFQSRVEEVLAGEDFADWTVGRYADHIGASPEFRDVYLYARAMGCFPMPDCHPRDYRIRDLVAFWKIHGVVGREPANRRCVVGGMHRYVEAFRTWFVARGGELRCGTRVIGIVRQRHGVEIRAVDAQDRHQRFEVSQVILANNAHEAVPLLEAPTGPERRILGSFPYQRARLVLHRDPRLLGRDEGARGAFNYVVPAGELPRVRPTITFFANRLAGLPQDVPEVFVTMNPHLEPRPECILAQRFFLHPVAGAANDAAAAQMEQIQGRNRTWYAGSYLVKPFVHESALMSGILAAERAVRRERVRRVRPARELAA